MRHKQSIFILCISLSVALLINLMSDNGYQVIPRSANLEIQHINIAEQTVATEEPIIEQPSEEQIEKEIVEQQVVEQPILEEPEPIEPEPATLISEPVTSIPKPKKITRAIVEPLTTATSVGHQAQVSTAAEPSTDLLDYEQLSVSYKQELSAWLKKFKRYPTIAKRRAYQGLVTVRFSINNEGVLLDHEIIHASQYKSLNNAVIKMLEKATPMPAIPAELQTSEGYYEYEIPVRFELTDK